MGVAAAGRFSRLTSLRAAFDAVFAGCFDGGAFAGALGLNMGRLSDHMREVHPAGSDRFGARRVHGLRTLAYTELPKSSNAWCIPKPSVQSYSAFWLRGTQVTY